MRARACVYVCVCARARAYACVCVCVIVCACTCACAKGAVTKWQWPGWPCMRENARREGCVSKRMLCLVCCAPAMVGLGPRVGAVLVQGCPGDALSFCLLVQLEFS